VANPAPLFTLSSRSGAGMDRWLDWLRDEARGRR
jgi:hypothetical protein